MMGEIPVKRLADSDLEAVLLKIPLKDRTRRLLLRSSGLDLPAFLALSAEQLQTLGLSADEAVFLESLIVDMHKEPWTPESLVPPVPSAAGERGKPGQSGEVRRPRFSALDLSAQLVNVGLHLQCIHSQLLTAERLIAAYTPKQLATFGFLERDNCEMLLRGMDTVADGCKSVAAQSRLLQARVRREPPATDSATSFSVLRLGGGIVIVGCVSGLVYLAYRRLNQ